MNAAAKPSKPLISVCIPTYEMHGLGATFLSESLEILSRQSLRDFNVIISDHSRDGTIRAVCESFSGRLDIRYHHNPEKRGNLSANFNNMIRHADGRLVKMLMQDDYLVGENSLALIAREFDLEKDFWLVTSSHNTRDGK